MRKWRDHPEKKEWDSLERVNEKVRESEERMYSRRIERYSEMIKWREKIE